MRQSERARILNRIADRSSRIVSPYLMAVLTLASASFASDTVTIEALKWTSLTVFFLVLLPLIVILSLVRLGKVTDIYVFERGQRTGLYLPGAVGVIICLGLLAYFRAPTPSLALVVTILVANALSLGLNLVCKVSLHLESIAGSATVLTILFGAWASPLLLLIPLIAWAKYRLK